MRYLDPKNDLTFKKIFGEHPDILIDLLNNLLPFTQEKANKITEISYLPSDLVPINPISKYSIVDVRCSDVTGRQFVIEMQMFWTDSFKSRVLFNSSKAYVRQLGSGEQYKTLMPVYSVNLVNETFQKDTQQYYHYYQIVNRENSEDIIKGFSFLFIELPKIHEDNLPKDINQARWLRFFTEIQNLTTSINEDLKNNPNIRHALELLEESAFTTEELDQYERNWDAIRVDRELLDDALSKGEIIGIEKSKKLIEEERNARIEAQRKQEEERNARMEAQRNSIKTLLKYGIKPEEIATELNLPLDEVNRIVNTL
jgi:predicted transposase/invertase (TIGR01784 family)